MSDGGDRAQARGYFGYALIVVAALGIVAGRAVWDGREALRDAEVARARGDKAAVIRHLGRSARMYVPGSPYTQRALDGLRTEARAAQKQADLPTERQCWEAIRAALLGARSLYIPFEDRLLEADKNLAGLYAVLEDPAVAPQATPSQRVAWHAERLGRRPGPQPLFSVLAVLGAVLWMGGAYGFIIKGLGANLNPRRRWMAGSVTAFVIGLLMFIVGLRGA